MTASVPMAASGSSPAAQFCAISPDQCYVLSDDCRIADTNEFALQDLSLSREDLISKQFHPLVAEESRDALLGMLTALRETGLVRGSQIRLVRGAQSWVLSFSGSRQTADVSGDAAYVLIGRDVSSYTTTIQKIEHRALHDQLTGAFNRWYLDETLKREKIRAIRYNHSIGFVMLDIDSFKQINDTHGHAIGDAALQWISSQVRSTLRQSDLVFRVGGDEFLVILPETDGEVDAVGRRIIEAISECNSSSDEPFLPIQVSVGTSSWHPRNDRDLDRALEEADRLMYADKRRKMTA